MRESTCSVSSCAHRSTCSGGSGPACARGRPDRGQARSVVCSCVRLPLTTSSTCMAWHRRTRGGPCLAAASPDGPSSTARVSTTAVPGRHPCTGSCPGPTRSWSSIPARATGCAGRARGWPGWKRWTTLDRPLARPALRRGARSSGSPKAIASSSFRDVLIGKAERSPSSTPCACFGSAGSRSCRRS